MVNSLHLAESFVRRREKNSGKNEELWVENKLRKHSIYLENALTKWDS